MAVLVMIFFPYNKIIYRVMHIEYGFDTLAEWLRRSTRNRLDLFRTGSSPVGVGHPLLPPGVWPNKVHTPRHQNTGLG